MNANENEILGNLDIGDRTVKINIQNDTGDSVFMAIC